MPCGTIVLLTLVLTRQTSAFGKGHGMCVPLFTCLGERLQFLHCDAQSQRNSRGYSWFHHLFPACKHRMSVTGDCEEQSKELITHPSYILGRPESQEWLMFNLTGSTVAPLDWNGFSISKLVRTCETWGIHTNWRKFLLFFFHKVSQMWNFDIINSLHGFEHGLPIVWEWHHQLQLRTPGFLHWKKINKKIMKVWLATWQEFPKITVCQDVEGGWNWNDNLSTTNKGFRKSVHGFQRNWKTCYSKLSRSQFCQTNPINWISSRVM